MLIVAPVLAVVLFLLMQATISFVARRVVRRRAPSGEPA
jgi:Flp pilus assembly protein TadG